jgi:hypothetical protein
MPVGTGPFPGWGVLVYTEGDDVAAGKWDLDMQRSLIVKGRLIGPRSVELDEPVVGMTPEVEVLIRPAAVAADGAERAGTSIVEFLMGLPAGTRSKEDIDQQLQAERDSWGAR